MTVCLILLSLLGTTQDEPVVLRYKYEAGKVERTRQSLELVITGTRLGQPTLTYSRQVSLMKDEVQAVDAAGVASIRSTLAENLVVLSQPDESRLRFDSRN